MHDNYVHIPVSVDGIGYVFAICPGPVAEMILTLPIAEVVSLSTSAAAQAIADCRGDLSAANDGASWGRLTLADSSSVTVPTVFQVASV